MSEKSIVLRNSLIIHEEKTKEITVSVVLYVIKKIMLICINFIALIFSDYTLISKITSPMSS